MQEINQPEVLAELETVFRRYEQALMDNDVGTLNGLFRDSPNTLRYGVGENLYGFEAIKAFRAGAKPLPRYLKNTFITTYGRDFATVNTEFHREGWSRCGRQSQTWVRGPEGWRIVSAHVSIIDLAGSTNERRAP
jgi:hypothetical protein